jgi:hypothetical protein
MLTIAGEIVMVGFLIWLFIVLFKLMFIGFRKNDLVGCLTMVFFGAMILGLVGCLFVKRRV